MKRPLTIHLMTATLAPGDAIGNYFLTQWHIFRRLGYRVRLYADSYHPLYEKVITPLSSLGIWKGDILWYHYSIYTSSTAVISQLPLYKIMDYHGITPPELFEPDNPTIAELCRTGRAQLPQLCPHFEAFVVHSDLMREELLALSVPSEKITKLPLCVDTPRLASRHEGLRQWLAQLDYLLFVGRVVPQKDVLKILELLALLRQNHPQLHLLLVGDVEQTPHYVQQLKQFVATHQLQPYVLFTGAVYNVALLAEMLRHARHLVVLSEWESFCVPLVEAISFGVPPIIHNLPPLPEVAGPAGIIIDKHNLPAAVQQLTELWQNPAAYAHLQQLAHQQAQQFTDQHLQQALQTFLTHHQKVARRKTSEP
jgi:glycosyltransferase involved in cell wall biosynthesis